MNKKNLKYCKKFKLQVLWTYFKKCVDKKAFCTAYHNGFLIIITKDDDGELGCCASRLGPASVRDIS